MKGRFLGSADEICSGEEDEEEEQSVLGRDLSQEEIRREEEEEEERFLGRDVSYDEVRRKDEDGEKEARFL